MRRIVVAFLFALLTFPAFAANYTTNPMIVKDEVPRWEFSPFVWNGELHRVGFKRSWTGWNDSALIIEKYDGGWHFLAETPWDYFLGNVLVDNGHIYVFGTTAPSRNRNSIRRVELDPLTWELTGVDLHIHTASAGVRIYNTSATRGPDKYVLVYETNEGVAFSIRFLQSTQGTNWSPLGGLVHHNFYSACPTIRYAENGYYMVAYMWNNAGTYETAIGRTNNFTWIETFQGTPEYTPYQQLLSPDAGEGNNNSDIDFVEWNGKVYFTYLTGNQASWAFPNDAWFTGTMIDFYRIWWPTSPLRNGRF